MISSRPIIINSFENDIKNIIYVRNEHFRQYFEFHPSRSGCDIRPAYYQLVVDIRQDQHRRHRPRGIGPEMGSEGCQRVRGAQVGHDTRRGLHCIASRYFPSLNAVCVFS